MRCQVENNAVVLTEIRGKKSVPHVGRYVNDKISKVLLSFSPVRLVIPAFFEGLFPTLRPPHVGQELDKKPGPTKGAPP